MVWGFFTAGLLSVLLYQFAATLTSGFATGKWQIIVTWLPANVVFTVFIGAVIGLIELAAVALLIRRISSLNSVGRRYFLTAVGAFAVTAASIIVFFGAYRSSLQLIFAVAASILCGALIYGILTRVSRRSE